MKLQLSMVIHIIFLLLLPLVALSQDITVTQIAELPEDVAETSGLIYLNGALITHNDSGDEARLFEIDSENGQVLNELSIENATNTDWEDLTHDTQYIYIADIGNNNGDRTDLKIYLLPLEDYLQDTDNRLSVTDSILFTYSDQQNFDPSSLHNFDAEGIISYEDSLYIFTKNRADAHTNIYSLPKIPGTYEAARIGRINSEGLVTGASLNNSIDEIMLTGYTLTSPFLIRISDFENTEFHKGTIDRLSIQVAGSYQIEAIDAIDENAYYITAEKNEFGEATLLRVDTDFLVSTNETHFDNMEIYPNPSFGQVIIKGLREPITSLGLYSLLGTRQFYLEDQLVRSTNGELKISFDGIQSGIYQLRITSRNNQVMRKLVIN